VEYDEKYPVPSQPDMHHPAPPPNYTVSVDHMEKEHKKCVKCFRVRIDGINSTENPFKNKLLESEIQKEVLEKAEGMY